MFWKIIFLWAAALFLLTGGQASAQNISMEIVADGGYAFPSYPVNSRDGSWRAYLQAERDARYGIRIRNQTDRRMGLVVAVDGRNIISGEKSYLSNSERMYIVAPYAEATYSGWRTGRDEVRRFYFTEEGDSYAGAWGDSSAMGVIAVAVYAEQRQQVALPAPQLNSSFRAAPAGAAAKAKSAESDAAAGTGFGEREQSASVQVEFTPESYPLEKHFLKYEWRETLCRKNIISCGPSSPPPRENRFWPEEDGYAPTPPGRR